MKSSVLPKADSFLAHWSHFTNSELLLQILVSSLIAHIVTTNWKAVNRESRRVPPPPIQLNNNNKTNKSAQTLQMLNARPNISIAWRKLWHLPHISSSYFIQQLVTKKSKSDEYLFETPSKASLHTWWISRIVLYLSNPWARHKTTTTTIL